MRFLTAGESHGPGLTVIVDDFPAGVPVSSDILNRDLYRRQQGYGRGGRMKIESDTAEFKAGVRFNKSTGAPISLWIENRDFKNWTAIMAAEGKPTDEKSFVRPRPGHADLAGYYKYGHSDLRDVLERASARETTARVAAGALAKALLLELGIELTCHVSNLGGIEIPESELPKTFEALRDYVENNDLRAGGSEKTLSEIRTLIDNARNEGTTLGGEIEVIAVGLPPGLGSYTQWDRKLDGQLAQAVMSVHAVKSVSIGAGDEGHITVGKNFHDPIIKGTKANTITRPSNKAGGLEGGVSNGMPLVVKAVMKPISTMITPLPSINLATGEAEEAHFERSDVTAVPACGVICEAMVAITLARAVLDKFGHDSLVEIKRNLESYKATLKPLPV